MNITKWMLSAMAIAVFSTTLQAQEKKVEWGISAGYGYTMPRAKDARSAAQKQNSTLSLNTDNLNGFHVGPIVTINASEYIGFQTGVLFNHFEARSIDKSQQALKSTTGTWFQRKTEMQAFDLPVRLMYYIPMAEDLTVFVSGGPNINYALRKVTNTQYYVEHKLGKTDTGANSYESGHFKALDLQLGIGLGIRFHGLSVRGGYDWGILNRVTDENVTHRANDLKVSLAYTF